MESPFDRIFVDLPCHLVWPFFFFLPLILLYFSTSSFLFLFNSLNHNHILAFFHDVFSFVFTHIDPLSFEFLNYILVLSLGDDLGSFGIMARTLGWNQVNLLSKTDFNNISTLDLSKSFYLSEPVLPLKNK